MSSLFLRYATPTILAVVKVKLLMKLQIDMFMGNLLDRNWSILEMCVFWSIPRRKEAIGMWKLQWELGIVVGFNLLIFPAPSDTIVQVHLRTFNDFLGIWMQQRKHMKLELMKKLLTALMPLEERVVKLVHQKLSPEVEMGR